MYYLRTIRHNYILWVIVGAIAIAAGVLVVYKSMQPPRPSKVILLFSNDFFGLAKLCGQQPRHSTARAGEDVILFDANGVGRSGSIESLFSFVEVQAQRANGSPLPLWSSNRPPRETETVGVWQGSSSQDQSCVYFFVGGPDSQKEANAAYLKAEFGSDGLRLLPKK